MQIIVLEYLERTGPAVPQKTAFADDDGALQFRSCRPGRRAWAACWPQSLRPHAGAGAAGKSPGAVGRLSGRGVRGCFLRHGGPQPAGPAPCGPVSGAERAAAGDGRRPRPAGPGAVPGRCWSCRRTIPADPALLARAELSPDADPVRHLHLRLHGRSQRQWWSATAPPSISSTPSPGCSASPIRTCWEPGPL